MLIAIAGQKGGTGKSTIAVALAAELQARGHKVLLVDADPQGTARTWGDIATEQGLAAPTIVAMGANMHQSGQLSELASSYDFTVIDCPGRDGRTQRSALLVSDVAVLPTAPSAAEAWAMAGSVETIREAEMVNPKLRACAVITKKNPRTVIGKKAKEVFSELGLPVLDSELTYRVSYQEFLASGRGLREYAPRDASASELTALLDEVLTFAATSEVEASEQAHG